MIDALDDADLMTIGEACMDMPLITGGSGVAIGLPTNFRKMGMLGSAEPADRLPSIEGHAAVLAGSCSRATLQQIEIMSRDQPALKIDPMTLAKDADVPAQALEWAAPLLADGPVLIYASDDPLEVEKAQEALGAERTGALIEDAMAEIARGLVDAGVRRLIVAGGETSGAVVGGLGIACGSGRKSIPGSWTASLRVRPETLCRITEFSEHESNGRELDEGERVAVEVLPVLGQSAAAVEPGDGAFDHPTPGLDDEALHPIGSLDDLGLEIGQDAGQGAVKDRALIGAVGEQFPEKGKQTEQGRQQRETAVAILNVGGGDDAVQQQALRIDQNMPLLALDQLAGIEAVAVDASPPFSALFTL